MTQVIFVFLFPSVTLSEENLQFDYTEQLLKPIHLENALQQIKQN